MYSSLFLVVNVCWSRPYPVLLHSLLSPPHRLCPQSCQDTGKCRCCCWPHYRFLHSGRGNWGKDSLQHKTSSQYLSAQLYFLNEIIHTFVTVPFEIIDGADITVLAGRGLTHSAGACAFTGLRTVLSHKPFIQLQDEGKEKRMNDITSSHHDTYTQSLI